MLIIYTVLSFYIMWVFYLAVMNLKRVRDEKKLTPLVTAVASPLIASAIALDVLLNVIVLTVVFMEIPKEYTISQRLRRYNNTEKGYRLKVAKFMEQFLDPFDPSGEHI
jgi:hypothetical protein